MEKGDVKRDANIRPFLFFPLLVGVTPADYYFFFLIKRRTDHLQTRESLINFEVYFCESIVLFWDYGLGGYPDQLGRD